MSLPEGEAAAGGEQHFVGAGDALAVAWFQFFRGFLVKFRMQRGRAECGELPAGLRASFGVDFGDGGDAVEEGAKIHSGAAAKDGEFAGFQFRQRGCAPPGGVGGVGGGADAVEAVGSEGFVFQ